MPAGAVPKDGPSAGVTMVTALSSLASGRPVRSDVGMTGEVTLNGRVLPIGGVKQKLLAAQRAGLKTVFIPQRNEPDLDDVPAEVLEQLDVRPVADVGEILALALEPAVSSEAVTAQPRSPEDPPRGRTVAGVLPRGQFWLARTALALRRDQPFRPVGELEATTTARRGGGP